MTDPAQDLAALFDGARFELRFSLDGQAAVRVLGGPVAARHAEPPDPVAPWSARAACGKAVGWLLAERAPADEPRAQDTLQRAVDRRSSLLLQQIAAQRGAIAAELLESITHRLRTDISALQVIAEGALTAQFEDDERLQIGAEVGEVGAEAQRRLSAFREAMSSPVGAEPLVEQLEGVGVPVTVDVDERPVAFGSSACARLLASDERLAGAPVTVRAHPDGWAVTVGEGDGEPVPWTQRALGELAYAGMIAVAASATERDGRLRVELALPALPSG